MPTVPAPSLIGRGDEIADLLGLVHAAEHGDGGALVLRGEPGIGKSALIAHVEHAAPGTFRVLRAAGTEFEAELPFAGLHQLCRPALDLLETLSTPYRTSLEVAFGLAEGAPDPFRVGLAALELLATAAARRPLLCLVDDAHWLDSASSTALAFLARRVAAEPIAIVFATRDQIPVRGLDELPGIAVHGLTDADARGLLARETLIATLDERVQDRLLAESRGNPLALIELPKSGGFSLPTPSPIASRIERSFQRRMAALPQDPRLLLILAGADPTGDPALVRDAARRLDLDVQAAGTAADASGLIMLDPRVRFCHPLARSAAYRAAEPSVLRTVHRALADSTDPVAAPDRQAWHRAQAATGPDEQVAEQLESSASRAQARGGVTASAAFLRRAAELSHDPRRQVQRTLAAAQATLETGQADDAATLLNHIDAGMLDDPQHASLDLLRGRIAFVHGTDGVIRGPELMVQAARRLATSDPERSRDALVAALDMGLSVGRAAGVLDRVLDAARAAPATHRPDLLDALVRLNDDGHRAAVPTVRQALTEGDACWARTPALATVLAGELWDLDLHAEIVDWLVRTGRETGAPVIIRLGLAQAALHAVLTGRFGQAMASIAEEEAVADAVGDLPQLYPRVHVAAMRGRSKEVLDLVTEGTSRSTGLLTANLSWAKAVLYNGLGDYPAALEAAQRAVASGDLFLAGFALPELVEAAVRCGQTDQARSALESLLERTDAAGTDFARAAAAGARALVTEEEDQYREALDHLSGRSLPLHEARAHLRYGEWLRRAGRRRDARDHLRIAHDQFAETGSEAFAQRAATELQATGEAARRRSAHTYDHLTMQEMHIARQVATGATTKEVATTLFLSPRTVDAHLRNIFRKLLITSRRQLRTLPDLR